jgi:nucleoside-diphosphate-sugar epimerase
MALAVSLGVYGDYGGEWVDETSPLRVTASAGKPFLRAQAEAAWLQLHAAHGVPVHVFRLGGIYGAQAHAAAHVCAAPFARVTADRMLCVQARGAACWRRAVRRGAAAVARGRATRSARALISATYRAATWQTSSRLWMPAWRRLARGACFSGCGQA